MRFKIRKKKITLVAWDTLIYIYIYITRFSCVNYE